MKARDVYRLVKELLSECEVDYFDTQEFQNNKMKILNVLKRIKK